MKIEAEVKLVSKEGSNVKARVNLTFDGMFAVHDISIINGQNGEFVSFPQRKGNDGYVNIANPITKEGREEIIKTIMEAYEDAKKVATA